MLSPILGFIQNAKIFRLLLKISVYEFTHKTQPVFAVLFQDVSNQLIDNNNLQLQTGDRQHKTKQSSIAGCQQLKNSHPLAFTPLSSARRTPIQPSTKNTQHTLSNSPTLARKGKARPRKILHFPLFTVRESDTRAAG